MEIVDSLSLSLVIEKKHMMRDVKEDFEDEKSHNDVKNTLESLFTYNYKSLVQKFS